MKQFQAVIFDMDGLLLDTERIALSLFLETCEHFALGDLSDVFLSCIGTNRALGERILESGLRGKIDHREFSRVWDAKYRARTTTQPIPLKPGATELLGQLTAIQLPLAVATSTATSSARQKLGSAEILHRFHSVIGGDQVDQSKPHPEIYLKAAAALGAEPKHCLALEDSENGVRSALAAGMTVVQIPDLVEPSPALAALGHIILPGLREVLRLLAD